MPRIRLPAQMGHINDLIRFVSRSAQDAGFNAKKIKEIELVTEEAVVNIISYAYPEETGDIEIRCNKSKGAGFLLEIMDTGTPFNPLSLPEPDITVDISQRNIGGLGIALMRKMVDGISYRREQGSNIITFIFRK